MIFLISSAENSFEMSANLNLKTSMAASVGIPEIKT